jgi:hypothetical protein
MKGSTKPMSLADKLGLGPNRVLTELPDGTFRLTVTPPPYVELASNSIILTLDQVKRYKAWLERRVLIQDVLWDLTPSQREVIMSGLDDEAFKQAAGADDDDTEATG